jgi:integrase
MMGLGPYAEVSLKEAREAARNARELLRKGLDPIEERDAAKRAQAEAVDRGVTFKKATERYHSDVKAPTLRSERSRDNWLRAMELHAYPIIGELPVSAIERRHVLQVLEPTWPRPSTQALRAQIEAVLEWAAVRGYRPEGANPADWRTLKYVLSAPSRSHKVSHHAALPHSEAPAFITELRQVDTVAARALELVTLTATRSGEVRGATWPEINLDAKLWTIPGERMKGGKTHRVPLSEAAVGLLKALPHRDGLLFTVESRRLGGQRPLYDHEVSLPLKKLRPNATVHGMRSSFKDWCRNRTAYADEVSELQLAHVSTDATRAAYARDELLEKRARLMAEWALFLEHGAVLAGVTDIGKARELSSGTV